MDGLSGERDLVRRFQAGEAAAFGAIMSHYEPYVLGMVRRMVPDRSRAEDLCQETFLKVLKGLGRFRGESGLKTWIFRIAHNVVADHARAAEPVAESLDARAEAGSDPPAPAPAPPDRLDERALRLALERAMGELVPVQREVLHLLYWQEFTVAQIAEVLGLPEGTVKTHLFRGRQALRRHAAAFAPGGAP